MLLTGSGFEQAATPTCYINFPALPVIIGQLWSHSSAPLQLAGASPCRSACRNVFMTQRERANSTHSFWSVTSFFLHFFFQFLTLLSPSSSSSSSSSTTSSCSSLSSLMFTPPPSRSRFPVQPDTQSPLPGAGGVHWAVPGCGATSFWDRVRLDFIFVPQCFSKVGKSLLRSART